MTDELRLSKHKLGYATPPVTVSGAGLHVCPRFSYDSITRIYRNKSEINTAHFHVYGHDTATDLNKKRVSVYAVSVVRVNGLVSLSVSVQIDPPK